MARHFEQAILTTPWRRIKIGAVVSFIAPTYAELAAAMRRAGGEHVYTHRALGAPWSFVCTWSLLMAYSTVCLFESVALPTAVEVLFPGIHIGTLWRVFGPRDARRFRRASRISGGD